MLELEDIYDMEFWGSPHLITFTNHLISQCACEIFFVPFFFFSFNLSGIFFIPECKPELNPNRTSSLLPLLSPSLSEHLPAMFVDEENLCSFAGQLGRETPASAAEGSSFFDRFVAWDEHMLPHTVISGKLSDVHFQVYRFSLRTTDTGSSLRVDVRVPSIEYKDKNGVRIYFSISFCFYL